MSDQKDWDFIVSSLILKALKNFLKNRDEDYSILDILGEVYGISKSSLLKNGILKYSWRNLPDLSWLRMNFVRFLQELGNFNGKIVKMDWGFDKKDQEKLNLRTKTGGVDWNFKF